MASSSIIFFKIFSYKPISCSLKPQNNDNYSNNNLLPTATKATELTISTDLDSQSNSTTTIKAPTAPWMKGPLLVQPYEVIDFSTPRKKNNSKTATLDKTDRALTAKESGVRGKKAVTEIVKRIERLRPNEDSIDTRQVNSEDLEIVKSLERIGSENGDLGSVNKKLPWVREDRVVVGRVKKEKVVTKAEDSLEKEFLERLREEAKGIRKWVKVNKAGITPEVVDQIKWTWKRNVLAMVKFNLPLCRNMDRAREILEMKTGGMVVWTRKDAHVIYRGSSIHSTKESDSIKMDRRIWRRDYEEESTAAGTLTKGDVDTRSVSGTLFERETDRLLDGLGPRFVDWWMSKPLPVDADLLPGVVSGFRSPLRLSPSDDRAKLRDSELTYLRKIAHAMPTHFVLGRNRRLQGLAAAIVKLWEKSHIAKIAIKWGALNTNNELMANELKLLTGGILILRNKFYIILYRGKDFLPSEVASSIADRETELRKIQTKEEIARIKAIEACRLTDEASMSTSDIGTLNEFQDFQMMFSDIEENWESVVHVEAEKEKLRREMKTLESKLFILESKIEKSTRQLSRLNSLWMPTEKDEDQEMMTEEERACFRKIGLRLQSRLVLGRRGIFNGVIEGLHQHWKYREVVKVITMQKLLSQVIRTAKWLEAESGGILVSVDKLKQGHAIILYRGKNYKRPIKDSNKHLLTKREALQRSLLMQKIGSLKFFAHQRRTAISDIKSKLAEVQKSEEQSI